MDESDYSVVNGVTVWQRPPRGGGAGQGRDASRLYNFNQPVSR